VLLMPLPGPTGLPRSRSLVARWLPDVCNYRRRDAYHQLLKMLPTPLTTSICLVVASVRQPSEGMKRNF
jgi:hypothetical protein